MLVQNLLYLNGTELLSEIHLLDEYTGKSIPEDYKSLCLQLLFKSTTETLQNKKLNTILKNLEQVLIKKFEANIRN